MKKYILIVASIVVIICDLVACTNNISSNSISTTVVTDSNGIKPVTDENKVTVNDVNDSTAVQLTTEKITTTNKKKSSAPLDSKGDNAADNNSLTLSKASTSTTKLPSKQTTVAQAEITKEQTQPVTDKDGWINKWY